MRSAAHAIIALDPVVAVAQQAEHRGARMRPQEPAHVEALDFCISDDGSGDTLAVLTLRLTDEHTPLHGSIFQVLAAGCPPPASILWSMAWPPADQARVCSIC